jgi:hypothetical protein
MYYPKIKNRSQIASTHIGQKSTSFLTQAFKNVYFRKRHFEIRGSHGCEHLMGYGTVQTVGYLPTQACFIVLRIAFPIATEKHI